MAGTQMKTARARRLECVIINRTRSDVYDAFRKQVRNRFTSEGSNLVHPHSAFARFIIMGPDSTDESPLERALRVTINHEGDSEYG